MDEGNGTSIALGKVPATYTPLYGACHSKRFRLTRAESFEILTQPGYQKSRSQEQLVRATSGRPVTGRHAAKAIHSDGFSVSPQCPVTMGIPCIALASPLHQTTCQNAGSGSSITFTCRAADAMLDTGEVRRHSRESVKQPRGFPCRRLRRIGASCRVQRLIQGSGGNYKPFR